MRPRLTADAGRLLIALTAAAALHGALFVAFDRLAPRSEGGESPVPDALRIDVAFARPTLSRHPRRESRDPIHEAPGALPHETDSTSEPTVPATRSAPPDASVRQPLQGGARPEPASTYAPAGVESDGMPGTADLEERGAPSSDTGTMQNASAAASAESRETFTDTVPTIEPERYVQPRYPEAARRAGLEGTVVLQLSVDRRGRVVSVHVTESSGIRELDTEAVRAARLWRFHRGEDDRESAHRIRFSLEEQ